MGGFNCDTGADVDADAVVETTADAIPEGLVKNETRNIQGVGGNATEYLGSAPISFTLRDLQDKSHEFKTDKADFIRSNTNELILTCQWLQKYKVLVAMENRRFYVPERRAWFSLRGRATWSLTTSSGVKRGRTKISADVLSTARTHIHAQQELISESLVDSWQSRDELKRQLAEAGCIKIADFVDWHAAAMLAEDELERRDKIEKNEKAAEEMEDDHVKDVALSLSCDDRECGPKPVGKNKNSQFVGRGRSAEQLFDELRVKGCDKWTRDRAIEHSNYLRGIVKTIDTHRQNAIIRAMRKRLPKGLVDAVSKTAVAGADEWSEQFAKPTLLSSAELKKMNGGETVVPAIIREDNEIGGGVVKTAFDATVLEDLRTNGQSEIDKQLVYTQAAADVETPEDVAEERDDRRKMRQAVTVAELITKAKADADFPDTGIERILQKRHKCFTRTDPGVKEKFHVELMDKTPVCQRIRYRFSSPAKRQKMREMLELMIAKNEIASTKSPWCSPVFLVPKKTPGKSRLIFDGREISKRIRKDAYPVPAIADLLENMALKGVDVVSTIDLKDFFFQFKLDDESSEIFAFNASDCGLGMLAYKVLPQGIAIAPALAQRALSQLLDSCSTQYSGVAVFCDDVCFYSSDPNGNLRNAIKRHHDLLDEALKRLCEAGFMVDAAKSHFFKKTAAWLGFRVGEGKLRPLEDYLEKLHTCAGRCKDKKDVRRTIGLLGYYSRFVYQYATKIEPLTRLTRKDVPFVWGKEQQEAVDKVLADMERNGALTLPDYEAAANPDLNKRRPFVMYTDASDVGAGGVLMQADREGVMRIVAFESKTFSEVMRNWDTTHREWFALQHCILKWRPYLDGTTFKAYTDHAALIPVLSKRYFDTPWQARWALKLQEFSFTLKHVEGLANAVADAASRDVLAPVLKMQRIMKLEAERRDAELALADAESEMDKVVSETLGEFDPEWILAPLAIPRFLPSQQNRIVQAQRNDPVISMMLRYDDDAVGFQELAAQHFAAHKNGLKTIQLRSGKLLVHVEKAKNGPDIERWVVPESAVRQVTRAMHGEGLCHMSADNMEAISDHLWWPAKRKFLRKFVSECPKCRMNPVYRPKPPPRSIYPDRRGQAIAMDLMFIDEQRLQVKSNPNSVFGSRGKIPEPKQTILLVAIDVATRYPFVTILKNKTAIDTATALLSEVVSHLGTPKRFISDQGGEFANNLFDVFFANRGSRHYLVAAGNSEANGIVERLNGSLRPLIEHIRDKWPDNWKDKISAAVFCARNRPHRALAGYTPAQMMFGMTPRSLIAAEWLHDNDISEKLNEDAKQFYLGVKEVTESLEAFSLQLREDRAVKERLKAYLKMPSTRSKSEPKFQKGDRVYVHLRDDGLKNPKRYRWGRPAEIVGPVPNTASQFDILLEDQDTSTKKPMRVAGKSLSPIPMPETVNDDTAQQGGVSDAELCVEMIV